MRVGILCVLVASGCRGLLGIEDGVIGDAGGDAGADGGCTAAGCACTEHLDCASELCTVDNKCANGADIAYVAGTDGSDGIGCTREAPCDDMVTAVALGRSYIKVTGEILSSGTVRISGGTRYIYGVDATLLSKSGGAILSVQGGAGSGTQVELRHVTIRDARGQNDGYGVQVATGSTAVIEDSMLLDNAGRGVSASGGTIVITRSVIAGNGNAGLVAIDCESTVTNSIIAENGNPTSSAGGVLFMNARETRFEHNTVANNVSMGTVGIGCVGDVAITNSIVVNNAVVNCSVSYSLSDSNGPGTFTGQPAFLSTTEPTMPTYFRIGAQSAARDTAQSIAPAITVDIDGDSRSGQNDVGADEYVP